MVLNDGCYHDSLKEFGIAEKIFLKMSLTKIQPRAVLNLFLISDKNPGGVSYKRVSYKQN